MKTDKHKLKLHRHANPRLFQFARELRKSATPEEQTLWDWLKTKPEGLKFRRQHPLDRYILDFYCHKALVCIELDGKHHYTQKAQINKDKLRDSTLAEHGILTLRFENVMVRENFKLVQTRILEVISTRR